MTKYSFSRRSFLKQSAIVFANYPLVSAANTIQLPLQISIAEPARINWIVPSESAFLGGVTFGVGWPQGKIKRGSDFTANDEIERIFTVQSWPLAYWPDGSLKWTGHALNSEIHSSKQLFIKAEKSKYPVSGLSVIDKEEIVVDTGSIRCFIPKKGQILIRSIVNNATKEANNEVAKGGRLILLMQNASDDDSNLTIKKENFEGEVTEVKVEQSGPIRAVIKVSGIHRQADTNQSMIPFVVRFYFYYKSESIRILHTIIYDGDENKHFIKGLGLAFDVPLKDELHNRHIRFVNSSDKGIFAEAVRGLSGLRRSPGKTIIESQLAGKAIPPVESFPEDVRERLQYIPAFGDYTLFQGSSGSFNIKKRTKEKFGWINCNQGERASGTAYLGTPQGGLVAGIRNFWQSYPGQIDVRKAVEDTGTLTMWLWAPESPAMDLRFYHDGMGQDTLKNKEKDWKLLMKIMNLALGLQREWQKPASL